MHKQETHITQADVKKTYKFYAPVYDFVFGAVLEPGRRMLCKEVQALQPHRILEIGVGTGLLLEKYPVSSKITGIDICNDMLNHARQKAQKLSHMDIELSLIDAEHLNFTDNSFDCVVIPYVLSVTPDPQKLVAEARRVCKKDGTIIILNHFSGSSTWAFLEKMVKNLAEKIGFRSEFSYEENISQYDWEILKVSTVNLFGLSKLIVIRNI